MKSVTISRDQLKRFNDQWEDCIQLVEVLMGVPRDNINKLTISLALTKIAQDRPDDLRFIKSSRLVDGLLEGAAFISLSEYGGEEE